MSHVDHDYVETAHPCPACGYPLLQVVPSNLMVCDRCNIEPHYLVPEES